MPPTALNAAVASRDPSHVRAALARLAAARATGGLALAPAEALSDWKRHRADATSASPSKDDEVWAMTICRALQTLHAEAPATMVPLTAGRAVELWVVGARDTAEEASARRGGFAALQRYVKRTLPRCCCYY